MEATDVSYKYIQTVRLDELMRLERKYYEQRARYRDDSTNNGHYWYNHWTKQLNMVSEELHRRAA